MYTLLIPLFYIASSARAGNNEFLVPPPAGVNATPGENITIKWRCDDCGDAGIYLDVWQARGGGEWAKEKILGTSPCFGALCVRARDWMVWYGTATDWCCR
jgi:hypothetical protein